MSDWFKDWFSSDKYLTVYSHRNKEDAEKLLNLILSNVQLSSGEKVLDAACGAGRHSISLTQKGFDATGFDLSFPLLKAAKKNAAQNGINLKLFRADIRDVFLKEKFDMILNVFTSFGYFNTMSENFSFIRHSENFIKKGGYFVFDFFNKSYVKKNLIPETTRKIDSIVINERREIVENRVVKNIELIEEGKINKFKESVYLYHPYMIIKEFEAVGYEPVKLFGNYDGCEFNELKSERFIAIFKA